MKNEATRHYKNQELLSASPARLVVMLYDRAMQSLNNAIRAIEAGEIEQRWKSNKNACEVITHLAMTLDHDKGGQIAQNLNDLYKFMLRTLVNVDVRNDPQAARDVIKLLEPLRESWDKIAKGNDAAATAPTAIAAIDNHADAPVTRIAISA